MICDPIGEKYMKWYLIQQVSRNTKVEFSNILERRFIWSGPVQSVPPIHTSRVKL
jgi:hypothetical protein